MKRFINNTVTIVVTLLIALSCAQQSSQDAESRATA